VTLVPASAFAWTERNVAVGGLHGTLTLPQGAGAAPAALILAGSGPVDRDGNVPGASSDSLKLLARGLADRGIASLRIDKRGIGASAAAATREEDLRFDVYVTDAVAWLTFLKTEPSVSRIVVIGHSEGGLVATLAAQRVEVAALILLAGAGEPADRIIARQLAAAGVPQSLQAESKRISDSLLQAKAVADVPPELAALYRPNVQNYLMSWLPLDPAAELGRVSRPVLIVQGTTDLQITAADAQKLAAARSGAKLVLIEGMNHVLKDAPSERRANLLTYVTPDLPLAPALVPAVADFIHAH
jgi:pimeloyl-ACP methyl ester carboxylesterase